MDPHGTTLGPKIPPGTCRFHVPGGLTTLLISSLSNRRAEAAAHCPSAAAAAAKAMRILNFGIFRIAVALAICNAAVSRRRNNRAMNASSPAGV
jgi:hypothetical protein